jgi:hypothetical protein
MEAIQNVMPLAFEVLFHRQDLAPLADGLPLLRVGRLLPVVAFSFAGLV